MEKSWHGGDKPLDFYDAKGVVESLLGQLGVDAGFEASSDESLRLGRQAAIIIAPSQVKDRLGVLGELHPGVLAAFDISEAVYLFEIDMTALLPFTAGHKMFQPVPRFPAVDRDIALVVDAGVTNQQVQDIIGGFSLVNRVALFDVYSGGQVPPGKKSLAYRITFQSRSQTLTDEAVDQVQQQLLDKLSEKLGATLRS